MMRYFRLFLLTILACGFAGALHAQNEFPVQVRGQVTDTSGKLVLYPATIRNKNSNARVFSDHGGYYRINANRGDVILVSYVGYVSDSFKVAGTAGMEVHNIKLLMQERFLAGVDVSSRWNPYQLDSIARYEEFRPFLETEERSLVDKSKRGPGQGGFGVVVSPFTRYSKKEKDLRKFKQIYASHEKQAYIDYRYSKTFVSRVTGLSGDSLVQFIAKYQPSYEMLRSINNEDLIMWISVRAKQWRKDPDITIKPGE